MVKYMVIYGLDRCSGMLPSGAVAAITGLSCTVGDMLSFVGRWG